MAPLAVVAGIAIVAAVGTAAGYGIRRYLVRRRQETRAAAESEFPVVRAFLESLIAGRLILDSNIWMGEDSESLFATLAVLLKEKGRVFEIAARQFDEIVAIKNLGFDDAKSRRARHALARIERYQKAGLLRLISLTPAARRSTHADAVIIEILLDTPAESGPLCLVTNDRELRIRAAQLVNDKFHGRLQVFDQKEILEKAGRYQELLRILDGS